MKYDSTDRIKGMAAGKMGFEDWRNGKRGQMKYDSTDRIKGMATGEMGFEDWGM